MFERFDQSAREITALAGNLAARRHRKKLGVKRDRLVTGVRVTLADLREAYDLVVGQSGWQGGFAPAAHERLERLRATKGPITTDEIREALR